MLRIRRDRSVIARSFLVLLLVCAALSTALRPVPAQAAAPRTPVICACVNEAIVMLGKYGIPFNALSNLLPLFNDSAKLTAKLSKYDLTPDEIKILQSEAKALIKKGLTPGAVQDFAVKGAQDVLKAHHVAVKNLKNLLKLGKDKAALESALLKAGAKKNDLGAIEKELKYYFDLALDEQAYDHMLVLQALDFLDYYGIPRSALKELLAALNNPAKFDAFMKKYGLTGDNEQQFQDNFVILYDWGLDEAALNAYLAQDLYDMLYANGLLLDQINQALAAYDDAQALADLLDSYGLTTDEINAINQNIADAIELGLIQEQIQAEIDQEMALEAELDQVLDPDGDGSMEDTVVEEPPIDPELENPPEDDGSLVDDNTMTDDTVDDNTGDTVDDNSGSDTVDDNTGTDNGGTDNAGSDNSGSDSTEPDATPGGD